MDYICEPEAQKVAEFLGFQCDHANPVATFRNPFGLEHWTMPILELLIIGGAIFALIHAWRRWRRDGDPINIALWFGSLVYLAVIEPPLYFPAWFGAEDYVGFIFSHNVFTVQFMFDRLPLYIVAFYPVITQVTYELVRSLGVFERRGVFAGTIATMFASQVFYETFDQLGPQLKWWAWNPENQVNQPMFASVPMNSMWVFASLSFAILVFLVVKFVGPSPKREPLSGLQVTWRTILAGVLTPILMVVGAAPSRVGPTSDGNYTVQRTLVTILLVILWLVGLFLVAEATRKTWNGTLGGVTSPRFAQIYPALYLGVHVALWLVALPAFLNAKDGFTSDGAPIGSGWYSIACILASGWFVIAALRATKVAAEQAIPAPATAS